jgi:glycosyltransferase involved in cell wall biosynthesis
LEKYDGLPNPDEARHQLNLPEGLTVGFTGHIYPGRGADLLFELAKEMPQVNFLWVGGTPELVEFWRGKLTEAKMTNVMMTGFVKHESIPLYQAASDILLMPYSRSIEASSGQDIAEVINPMKMFEYMASGRAIVSADLPSIREVLNDGSAVFCSAGNWELVISNWRLEIERLLADESCRLALGAQGRKDVASFTWVKREERVMERITEK